MSIHITDKERRQSKRYGINLGAILALEESITLQCNILDFCTHGLFLEIKESYTDISHLLHRKGRALFSVTTEQGREYVQVDVEVMRVCQNGVGVAFEKIPDSVFNGLIKKANSQSKPELSGDLIQPFASVNLERFKTLFKEMLNDNLPILMNGFITRALNDLEQAGVQTGNFIEQAVFLNAARDLRLFHALIDNAFKNSVLQQMDFVRKLNIDKETDSDGHALSLVDKDDFEDWLNLSSSIRKVESNFSVQLYQLELKLSKVTGIPRNYINNPISPARLYDSFKKSVSNIEEIRAIRQTLYKVFEEALINNLQLLYKPLEKLLGDFGAPDRIVEEIVRQPDEPPKHRRNISSKINALRGSHPTGQYPAVQHGQQKPEIPGHPISPVPHLTNRTRQGQPLAQTASNLLDIINQRDTIVRQIAHGNLAEDDNAISDELSYPAYSFDEIVTAIAQLQEKEAASNEIHQDSVTLQKHLSDTLAAAKGSKQFSSIDKNRLEVYGQLFDTLMNDLMFIPHIKSYLEAIHLPLMALALNDSDFLDSETHPARSILNQLFSLEGAVKGNRIIKNNKIRQTLDQLFNRITQESISNPEIFAIVEQELKKITQPVVKSKELNIRRVIEAYEGKQKLDKARNIIREEIDNRIAGKLIPEVISALLDSGWQHLLVITELNDENNANARQRYLKVIDKLLDWLTNREPFSDEQIIEIQRELAFIENQLGSVCANAFLHGKVMDELKAALLGTGHSRVRKPVEKIFIEPRKPDTVNPIDIIENNWTLQVDRLQIGEWFALSLEAEEFEPLKLVWIGDEPRVFVFVNREGQKKLELGRDELAALMRTGSVNKIENLDESLMDRAANMMLHKMHQKLAYNASHDPITQLINRREWIKQLKEEISSLDSSRHMLCYLEILDFRMITNICGLMAGDELIKNTTQLIKSQLGQDDIIARLGDDTFGLLIKECSDEKGYEAAKKLRENINKSHFVWQDKSYSVGVSIGLTPFFNYGYTVEELLQQADSAGITAKSTGHSRICLYKENDEKIKARSTLHDWVGRIDQIFAENRLFIRCQKIAPIEPKEILHSHYELLLGVRDESGNIIAPGDFLPAVEHCRRMPEIDQWMINTAFKWIEQNKNYFDGIGGFAINLSGQSLNSEEFLEHLIQLLTACDLPQDKITFEVTETIASDNLVFTERFISEIKQFGCKFSLDDFGTGYSSYSYLKNLEVDYLKIDGSFIKEIANNPADVAMVKSMNEIAHSLGLETIAEYVENDEIHAILKEIGVDYGQGWNIHKPVALTELVD